MNREELKAHLANTFSSFKVEENVDFPVIIVDKNDIADVAKQLKESPATRFDFLFCETAVDRLTHLEVIYHLTSTELRQDIVLKVNLEREKPEIESVVSLWKAAELYECEIYDLFGIRFLNHPSLRRLFLGDEWIGYPLRKDYKDDVNILPL
jgi:NADH-quinone oxidoreductase subunit C